MTTNGTKAMSDALYRVATIILGALVMFLAGWVWNQERRTTTLEVQRQAMFETVQEIKSDVKEIRRLVTDR
jgi:hypothetical protein